MRKKLKVGVLLDKYEIPAWSYVMLENISASSSAEIVLIVKNKSEKTIKENAFRRIISNHKSLLYSLFSKVESILFKVNPNAFELKDIRDFLTVDTIEVSPIKTKFRDKFKEEELKIIREYEVDIFIRMGFRILSGDILNIATYGVWSYHHGDNKVNRGMPAGFWEVMERCPESGVVLQILTEDLDDGIILHKSFSLTDKYSPSRNRNNYYWKALSFLPSKIEELYKLGEEDFFKKVDENNSLPVFYSNRLYKSPTNKEMFFLGTKLLINYLTNKINSLFYFEQWILLFNLNSSNNISKSFFKFKKIIPPKDRFWADPHIIKKDGKYYIFIEELMYSTFKGHISLIVMDGEGRYTQPIKVIEKDYHMSYPFLIEDKGTLYMIPETAQNNTVELYKCTNFPLQWKLEKVLMNNITAVDSTVIFKDDRYWLFANIVKNKGASSMDELYLFSSDKLVSENWIPHPQNPIVSDVKRARPAGSFFTYKNNLYRPSQNSSKRYGYGMKINQVIKLDELNYKEIVVDTILPNWDKDILSTHTFNYKDNLTVIDAQLKRRK